MHETLEAHRDPCGTGTLLGFSAAARYNAWLLSRLVPWLARPGAKPSLLEVGCGIGNLTSVLARDFTVTAVDIRPDYTAHVAATLGVETRCVDLVGDPCYDSRFETLLSANVLEHVAAEDAMLAAWRQALAPGGRLAVLVPAHRWLYGTLDRELGHERRYTRRSLRAALEKNGFTVKKTGYFNVFGTPGWWWQGRVRKHRDLPQAQLDVFDRLVPLFKLGDLPFRPFVGVSVIAWAEKA